jgi:predicted nucleic acid-binding Zn ribbon protein
MHRKAGTVTDAVFVTTPDQQRTTPQGRRAAQHPGYIAASSPIPRYCSAAIAPQRVWSRRNKPKQINDLTGYDTILT